MLRVVEVVLTLVQRCSSIPFRRRGPRRHRLHWLLLVLALIGSGACGPTQSRQSNDFGPLAVIDGLGGEDALGGTGPVHIGDSCVTMTRSNGEVLLLIWHAPEVGWDEQSREITFNSAADPGAAPITIRDGDTITVGGASLQDDEPVTRDLVWLATPQETCSGEPFAVSSILTKP